MRRSIQLHHWLGGKRCARKKAIVCKGVRGVVRVRPADCAPVAKDVARARRPGGEATGRRVEGHDQVRQALLRQRLDSKGLRHIRRRLVKNKSQSPFR